jgi:hypothetical protein
MFQSARYPILLVSTLALAFAATSDADHSWGNYHWARTGSSFTLKTGNNVNQTWFPYLAEAVTDWNQASELNLEIVAGGTRPKSCRPTAGRIEVCNAAYGFTNWLGIAQISISGDHITQGVAKMNDSYFNTTTYNTPAWRRLVMCQEIAHDFGLDHQDENFDNPNLGSCMDYTSDPDGPLSNEHPNAHDFEQITAIYTHTDTTTTVAAAAPGAAAAALAQGLDSPGQWGRLVRSNGNGRVQMFERSFGRGQKVITHVFWADPHADAHNH